MRLPVSIKTKNTLIACSMGLFLFITACESTPTEKLVSAQETAKQANTDLEKAKADYQFCTKTQIHTLLIEQV